MLRGVIFDVEGTLIDSNDAHALSWAETFAEAGYEVPFDVVRPLIRDEGRLASADLLAHYESSLIGREIQ